MWPSEPGVTDLLMILCLPLGAAIMLTVGWIIMMVKDHKRER